MSASVMPKKGRFYPVREEDGAWLIWSYHWNCWHCRSATGGAAGYTSDIKRAGVFDFAMAKAYHDKPPHRRDAAIPARRVVKMMRAALAEIDAERARFSTEVAKVEAVLTPRATITQPLASGEAQVASEVEQPFREGLKSAASPTPETAGGAET